MQKREDGMENENNTSSISKAASYEEMADFWDKHSTADYDDQTYEMSITFASTAFGNLVAIETELMRELRELAHQRRISPETLINVWLQQSVDQVKAHTLATAQD
jgi:hypothetical protein